ncbi:NnrS protein [Sulfurivirga caldicuralii]|uniref:NnrS protein n=1 Tax=Sulfurivirga caldicuralii TaxID=364032 RepID=A0A1N6EUV5_9GAMM|nr:NnrS protein [Sulfurivirga caldicuralii]
MLGLAWLLALTLPAQLHSAWTNAALWHGHEMVFGFGFAVITGFLLTAIRNWTGLQTLHRWPLALLALLWLTARFANAVDGGLIPAFIFDSLFGLGAADAITYPIVRARQWKQMGLISALIRVLGPLFMAYAYTLLIQFSLILWILGWSLFTLQYLPYWLRPRVDGHYG